MTRNFFPVAIILGIVSHSIALATDEVEFSPSLLWFNYSEYSDSGSLLDNESGIIPGIELDMRFEIVEGFNVIVNSELYNGRVIYDGHTQSGISHKTKTEEKLAGLELGLEKKISVGHSLVSLRIFMGSKIWNRNINSANGVRGLLEDYTWKRAGFGVNMPISVESDDEYAIGVDAFKIKDSRVRVDLTDLGFGQPQLDLPEKNGVDVFFDWKTRSVFNCDFNARLNYEYFQFGRSAGKVITNPQGDSATILEPRSETRNITIQLRMKSEF